MILRRETDNIINIIYEHLQSHSNTTIIIHGWDLHSIANNHFRKNLGKSVIYINELEHTNTQIYDDVI